MPEELSIPSHFLIKQISKVINNLGCSWELISIRHSFVNDNNLDYLQYENLKLLDL